MSEPAQHASPYPNDPTLPYRVGRLEARVDTLAEKLEAGADALIRLERIPLELEKIKKWLVGAVLALISTLVSILAVLIESGVVK